MEKAKSTILQAENKVYRDQLVTLGDLQEFKDDLLLSIKNILNSNSSQPAKKWLKSYEVKKLLGISKGTLQTLRDNGTLAYTRIGRPFYYDADDIQKLLIERKQKFQSEHHPYRKRQNPH
jgi:hypothetical protein